MKHFKYRSHIFLMFCFLFFTVLLIFPKPVSAALKTSELETVPWNMVTESSIINEKGWLQSMCATDQYIVCLVNASKKTTEPDTLIAFYRNTTDADGNPVEQYSYAFSVTETDYEHGNGMTYNPNTQEIAIAGLFTNDPSNAGAVFIVDANTLHFKRKVQVGNGSINFFGIDYVPEKDQYVLMANRIADYAFYFTDSNFEIVDKLNLHLSYSRSSFQDFCVSGDSIISIPYMQREGYMNVLDVYSISQQKRVGSYYLTLPGHDAFEVEPEGICQLEPGHLLMASAIIGTTRFRLYEATLPLVHSVTTSAEKGKISDSNLEIDEGDSCTVSYACDDDHRLQSLIVDGEEVDISQYPLSYTFTDVQEDHTIQTVFEEIPVYTVSASASHGQVEATSSGKEHHALTVSFTPEEHYVVDTLTVDGQTVPVTSDTSGYTFDDLASDHTIEVTFKPVPSYTITVNAKNGTVDNSPVTVYRGDSYTTTVTPDASCILRSCTVDGKEYPFRKGEQNITLTSIQADHTIELVYSQVDWILVFLIGILVLIVILLLILFYLKLRRWRRKKRRKQELRQMRQKDIAFFETLEQIDLKGSQDSYDSSSRLDKH